MESFNGKLLVYASGAACRNGRLEFVNSAVRKIASMLHMDVKIVILREGASPIYVYYKSENTDLIPIYCDRHEKIDLKQVYDSMKNMMFVLSFHPKFSSLKRIRNRIMRFS